MSSRRDGSFLGSFSTQLISRDTPVNIPTVKVTATVQKSKRKYNNLNVVCAKLEKTEMQTVNRSQNSSVLAPQIGLSTQSCLILSISISVKHAY